MTGRAEPVVRLWHHLCQPCQVLWQAERDQPCWLCDQPATVAVPIIVTIDDYYATGTVCPEDLWREPA